MPAAAVSARSRQLALPIHDYVESHHLLKAAKEYGSRRRLRQVEDLLPSGVVACSRIKEFAYDLGAEMEWSYGWKALAARRMQINYRTLWNIITGVVTTVNTATVDHIARHSGIPISVFYDPEI